jgi:mRNA-degrading endonuclease toxin of MazEF toxin-antitoxin module
LTTKITALKDFIQQELEKLDREQLQQVFEFSETLIANFEPKQGSSEAGVLPTIIFPNNTISMYRTTVISIPLTTNQRRASVPSSVCIPGCED